MEKLKQFYDARVARLGDRDFLAQVSHTVDGKPLAPDIADLITSEIYDALKPTATDRILDLCCGNGFFSHRLAKKVATLTGVELSHELVRIAKTYHAADNISYVQGDANNLAALAELQGLRFSKVVMNTGLQHFNPRSFETFVKGVLKAAPDASVLVFHYVPEAGKQNRLFDTPTKRLRWLYLRATGRDFIGYWWKHRDFENVAKHLGLNCAFLPINPRVPYSTYRLTVKLAG
jgi:2-polyprenyl-3-methyl-5-hydroxy-6-metoxy-1,4-benzoquinol methylase